MDQQEKLGKKCVKLVRKLLKNDGGENAGRNTIGFISLCKDRECQLPKCLDCLNKMHLISIIIFTNASARAGYDTRSVFKRSLTDFNSEFSFC